MAESRSSCAMCGTPLAANAQFCTQCGATVRTVLSDTLRERVQELLGAELELQEEVGRGGMAVVYSARDPLLERRVAVKAMLPELAFDAEMSDRFLREARTAAQLQHPNVVSIFGVRSRGDLMLMLMAFVEGRSLDAVLSETGPLPLPVAGRLAADIASALQYAHEHKVIHRDIKPANVLLASNGGALVSDFGIARRQDVTGVTGEGVMLGSLSYMSPEQRYGEPLTGATDQYALGVTAFEMLAGRKPFVGAPAEIHQAHMRLAPPSVREFRPEVPAVVADAITRMMAKSPADRFPDLREPKRIFERLVTDARSVSAEIALLSGVIAAPSQSRVMSAVRKAPTMPMAKPAVPASAVMPAVPTPVPAPTAAPVAESAPAVPSPAPTAAPPRSTMRTMAMAGGAVVVLAVVAVVLTRGKSSTTALPATASPAQTQAAAPAAAPGGVSTPRDAASDGAAPSTATALRAQGEQMRGAAPTGAATATVAPSASSAGVPLPNATLTPTPQPAVVAPAPATPEAARPQPTEPAASLNDARAAARAFVTMINQHRARDIERLADVPGGDAAARKSLERLIRDATDFAAGFERMASEPEPDGAAMLTEFVVDATWRSGGKDVEAYFEVRLRMVKQGESWVPAAYAVRQR